MARYPLTSTPSTRWRTWPLYRLMPPCQVLVKVSCFVHNYFNARHFHLFVTLLLTCQLGIVFILAGIFGWGLNFLQSCIVLLLWTILLQNRSLKRGLPSAGDCFCVSLQHSNYLDSLILLWTCFTYVECPPFQGSAHDFLFNEWGILSFRMSTLMRKLSLSHYGNDDCLRIERVLLNYSKLLSKRPQIHSCGKCSSTTALWLKFLLSNCLLSRSLEEIQIIEHCQFLWWLVRVVLLTQSLFFGFQWSFDLVPVHQC